MTAFVKWLFKEETLNAVSPNDPLENNRPHENFLVHLFRWEPLPEDAPRPSKGTTRCGFVDFFLAPDPIDSQDARLPNREPSSFIGWLIGREELKSQLPVIENGAKFRKKSFPRWLIEPERIPDEKYMHDPMNSSGEGKG